MSDVPAWFGAMSEEDRQFLKRFVLHSGSLKDLATEYGVSYPTIRGRLDRMIAVVKTADEAAAMDAFELMLRVKVVQGVIPAADARALLTAHRASHKQTGGS